MMYTFSCSSCGKVFESRLSFNQYDTCVELGFGQYIECPECGSNKINKLILNVPTTIFKGNGFTKSTREE